MTKLLVIDTETGGLDPRACGLTEVAAVVAEHNGDWNLSIVETFVRIIKPTEGLAYEPRALEIQHRTIDDLRSQGQEEYRALSDLSGFLRKHFPNAGKALHFYAHNAPFDLDFLKAAFERNGYDRSNLPFNFMPRCSVQLYRWLADCEGRTIYTAKLESVCGHYRVKLSPEEQHTAAADVLATAYCVGHMMRAMQGMKTNDVPAPVALSLF